MIIPLALPDITRKEIKSVVKVLKSNILSIGPELESFERKAAQYKGVKHAIGVSSGTAGLHLLIRAMGIGRDDEVITTPFSFAASTNCILYEGAKPVFIDIDPDTLNMDIDSIEEKITAKTKAILPVDVFGQPMDIRKVTRIASKYNLKVIEDSCEAIGSEYEDIRSGSYADGAVFAFYPNKQITTGEGGVIVTNDENIANLCRSMRNQGRGINSSWLQHERLGYNYRMDELSAALGSIQMDRLDSILSMREKIASMYNQRLQSIKDIKLPYISPSVTRMSWFVYVIRLESYIDRDKVMEYLIDSGVSCRPYFPPIHLQPYIRETLGCKEGTFPITEKVSASTLALPFFNKLKRKQVDYVAVKLEEAIKMCRKLC